MKVIAISNRKGGVGKTTAVINLGAALAAQNKNVVLIDLDPQASLTKTAGIDTAQTGDGAYNLFMGRELVYVRKSDNLAIIPTSSSLALISKELDDHINPNGALKQALVPFEGAVDYFLLDTPPALDRLTLNALVAADRVIIPCQCQVMALLGLQDLALTLQKVKTVNSNLDILAVLPTIYSASQKVEQEALAILKDHYGDVCWPPIPNRVEYKKASAEQRPVSGELAEYWNDLSRFVIKEVV